MRTAFEIGEKAQITKQVTEGDIALFAQVTGDDNPLHMDAEFAARSRFGQRIAHGMLSAGLISAVLGTCLPGPGGIYLSQSLSFMRPVFIGDTITAGAEVSMWRPDKRILRLATRCLNQNGEEVVVGEAVLLYEAVS